MGVPISEGRFVKPRPQMLPVFGVKVIQTNLRVYRASHPHAKRRLRYFDSETDSLPLGRQRIVTSYCIVNGLHWSIIAWTLISLLIESCHHPVYKSRIRLLNTQVVLFPTPDPEILEAGCGGRQSWNQGLRSQYSPSSNGSTLRKASDLSNSPMGPAVLFCM